MEGEAGADAASVVAHIAKWTNDFYRVFQYYLDRSTPQPMQRWLGFYHQRLSQGLKTWIELYSPTS